MLILILLALLSNSPAHANGLPGWQTYCATEPSDDRPYEAAGNEERVVRIAVEGDHSHDMFAFSLNGNVRLQDRVTGEQWAFANDRFISTSSAECPPFKAYEHTFTFTNGSVHACSQENCKSIPITDGSFIFAFAAAERSVVALTNYGGVLLFRHGKWCRMRRHANDVYWCPPEGEPMRTTPREVQFYSSVRFEGRTLVGEWPTGRIYEFDGISLRPWRKQPPFVSADPVGYEAQSMAVYCGDLYVGYWPRGEVWRLDRERDRWSLAASLFPPPANSTSFVPYEDRIPDDRPQRYYGRRVSALVPNGDSLYAVTANLLKWEIEYNSPILTPEESDHYGAVYRIERQGCEN